MTWLTTRQQMNRDLPFRYDRELRSRRFDAHASLYRRTKCLPRYWSTMNPKRSELPEWADNFHDWYFEESGGMLLTNTARHAYFLAMEAIASSATTSCQDPFEWQL
jgi:hypothetical protein